MGKFFKKQMFFAATWKGGVQIWGKRVMQMLEEGGGSFSMWGGSYCRPNECASLLVMLATLSQFGGDAGVLAGDAGDAAWGRGGSFSMWGGSTCKLNEPPQVC